MAQRTVGEQLIRSIDSFGANIVEADGREQFRDSLRFFFIARGSGREARHWIERAVHRSLINEEVAAKWHGELTEQLRMLQGIVRYRRDKAGAVHESVTKYFSEVDIGPRVEELSEQ